MVQITPEVIAAAQASQRKWGIPASVTIAQFGVESAWGTRMPKNSNNPFGIKAKPGEPAVIAGTREVYNGKDASIKAPFRQFANFAEAFDAHGRLLATVSLYRPALEEWRRGNLNLGIDAMAKHYATDPHYAATIKSIIASNNLTRYDNAVDIAGASPVPPSPPRPTPAPHPVQKWDWLSELILALLALFGIRRK